MTDSDEHETAPDGGGNDAIEITMSVRQVVAVAVVFGFLLGTVSTSVAFNAGLLDTRPGSAAALDGSGTTPTGNGSGTPAAATDGTTSITDRVSGVEADAVANCMEANREQYLEEIQADRSEAGEVDISGTPSFLVYRTGTDTAQRIVGAQPYGTFNSSIEAHLDGRSPGNVSADIETAGEPYLGSKDAPVTVVYWTDYQCPFCERFDTQVLPRLVENYVESGEVRVVVKDFAFLGEDSRTAALASRCVWERSNQSTFAAWHRTVFENQGAENSGWASRTNLVG